MHHPREVPGGILYYRAGIGYQVLRPGTAGQVIIMSGGNPAWDDLGTVLLSNGLWVAKGDLIVGTGNDAAAIVSVGADDTILMADAAQSAGVKWVASGTPSTQAFGDSAVVGTADTFTRGDHKHAMPADPVTAHAAAADPHTGYVLESLLDAKGDLVVASAADTPAKLTVGGNGDYPRANSGASTGIEWQKNNMAATVAPTANEDTGDGYSVGSRWIDTTNDKEYVCLDATLTAAVWTETTIGAGSGGHTIEDEGTPLTARTKLNFVGLGVTVTDDSGDDASVVTIGSAGSGDAVSVNGTAAADADFDDATPAAPSDGINVKWQKDSSAPDNISAYLDLDDLGIFQNEVRNFPSMEGADDAQPEWWEEENANATLTEVDVSGEGITETFERALKVVTTGANEYAYQRYTYADEPRLKSGRTVSAIAKVWSVGGVSARIRLNTSTPTSVVSSSTTAAAWTTLRANALVLDGTYVQIELEVDTGTAYFAEITVMVGSRAVTLKPRGLRYRWVDSVSVKSLTGLADEATWTDIDVTANSSPLAAIASVHATMFEASGSTHFRLYMRRNGSAEAAADTNALGHVFSTTGSTDAAMSNDAQVLLDDGQIFEYHLDRTSGATTLDSGVISLRGWWEWE